MTVQVQNSYQYYNGPYTIGTVLPVTDFTFIDNSHVSLKIRGIDEVWEYGTDYTVAGADTTVRTITLNRAVEDGQVLAAYLDVPITQGVSPEEGGNFPASTQEFTLDKLTYICQMLYERVNRSLQVSVDTEFNGTLEAPLDNIGKAIIINSTGEGVTYSSYKIDDLEAIVRRIFASIDNIDIVAENIGNVNIVAPDITKVNTVATNIVDVNKVAAAITNVNKVADDIANVNKVANDTDNIDTVATHIDNVDAVAPHVTNIDTVATHISNVDTTAAHIANIDTTAGHIANIDTTAAHISNVDTVATNISDVNTVATNVSDVNTVATNITDVNTTAAISNEITAVATQAPDIAMMAAFVYVDCGFFGDTQLVIHDAGDFGDEPDSYIDCGDFNEFFMSQDDFRNVFQIPSIKRQIEEANLDVDNLANDFIAFKGKTQTDIDNLDQRTKILTYVDCGYFGETPQVIYDSGEFGATLDKYIDCGDFREIFISRDDLYQLFTLTDTNRQLAINTNIVGELSQRVIANEVLNHMTNIAIEHVADDLQTTNNNLGITNDNVTAVANRVTTTEGEIDDLQALTDVLVYIDCGKFGEIQNTIHDAGDFGDSPDYLDCGNFDTVSYISRDDVSNLNSFGHLETEVTNLKNKVTSELNRTDSYINSSYRLIAGTRTDTDELQNIVSVFAYTDCGKFGETRNTILDGGEFGDRQLSNLDCGDFNGYYVSREDLKAVTQILNMQDKLSNLISLVQDYEKRLTKLEQGIDCGNFTAV